MEALSITETEEGQVTVLTLTGVLDAFTLSTLTRHLDDLVSRGRQRLVLELSAVGYIASAGIGAFIALQRRTQDLGGGVWLLKPSASMTDIIAILGIDSLFPIHHDRAAALAAAIEDPPA